MRLATLPNSRSSNQTRRPTGPLALVLMVAANAAGCAGWDNPTALSELTPEVEFEIAAEIETFEEVEIQVRVTEGGMPLELRQALIEMEPAAGGPAQMVELTREGDAYAAHGTFYEPGEHHLHFFGMPHRHRLSVEMGEHEVEVMRHHQVIGPYWVELEVSPAPVFEEGTAHLHLFTFDLLPDGSRGDPVGGLDLELEVHAPNGVEAALAVVEEDVGEYEAEHTFGSAGIYELHVAIDVAGIPEDGEFHLPILGPDVTTGETGGGHGHG